MQRVDPFIPASPRRADSVRPLSAPRRPQLVKYRNGVMDVFVRPQKAQKPAVSVSAPVTSTAIQNTEQDPVQSQVATLPPRAAKSKPKSKHHRLRKAFGFAGLAVVVLVAGAVVQTLVLGEILIGIYAVYALWRRVASRTTFMLALVALVSIVVLRAIGKDSLLAANFAVYALLLAFVGVLTLAREARQSKV